MNPILHLIALIFAVNGVSALILAALIVLLKLPELIQQVKHRFYLSRRPRIWMRPLL